MANSQKGQLADRIDRLSNAAPYSRLTRSLACTALLAMAAFSAPYTIAGTDIGPKLVTETQSEFKSVYRFSQPDVWSKSSGTKLKDGGTFEIVSENDTLTAYQIFDSGISSQVVPVNIASDGAFELTLQNGEVVRFFPPKVPTPPDAPTAPGDVKRAIKIVTSVEGIDGLKNLEALEGLEGLAALRQIKSVEGQLSLESLSNLDGLANLEDLSSLSELAALESLADISTIDINETDGGRKVIIVRSGDNITWEHDGVVSDTEIQDVIKGVLSGEVDSDKVRILNFADGQNVFSFSSDAEPELGTEFVTVNLDGEPGEIAIRELERSRKHLQDLIDSGDVSADLRRALDEISRAKEILESSDRILNK